MPKRENREYRNMPVMLATAEKRLESDCYVEGYATTFDEPYVLFEYDGIQYKEVIDRNALKDADFSDVLFQYNHSGRVFARSKMKQGLAPTLLLEPDSHGLFIAADLSKTEEARKMYEDIEAGLIYQMSWAFTVEEESYNVETHTRTILKIKKVYDVSAVDLPANPSTDIYSRNAFDGFIEAEKLELAKREEREKKIKKIKIMTEVFKNG